MSFRLLSVLLRRNSGLSSASSDFLDRPNLDQDPIDNGDGFAPEVAGGLYAFIPLKRYIFQYPRRIRPSKRTPTRAGEKGSGVSGSYNMGSFWITNERAGPFDFGFDEPLASMSF